MSLTKNLPYQPLDQDNHPISDTKPPVKITRILFSARSKSAQQIRKERPRILHQISPSKKSDGPAREQEIQTIAANIKQLRFLKSFVIELGRLIDLRDQDLNKLIKSLKHIKSKDRSIFYGNLTGFIHAEDVARFCPIIRQIDRILKRKIILYFSNLILIDEYKKLLRAISKLKYFIGAYFSFMGTESVEIYGLMDILKTSRSLCVLSLTLHFHEFSSAAQLQELFDNLRQIKSLKAVKLYFKWCLSLDDSKLKEFQSVLKGALQDLDIHITFDNISDGCEDLMPNLYEFEWRRFVKSSKKLNTSRLFRAKFVGKFKPRFELVLDWGPWCLLLLMLIVIFVMIVFIWRDPDQLDL